MSSRILVSVIGVPILLLLIFLAPVWALAAAVGIVAAVSAYEFMHSVEPEANIRCVVYTCACAFLIPLLTAFFDRGAVYNALLFALFAALFAELMFSFRKSKVMDFETVCTSMLCGGAMPIFLSNIVLFRMREHGISYTLIPFLISFGSDTGAFFVGKTWGRHALTPRISPHKTIEGSIGGFVTAIVVMIVFGLVLRPMHIEAKSLILAVYGFLGALASQVGDLAFSSVKRMCGIKDYSHLLLEHGGMLDRFDSVIWASALLGFLVDWVPAI